MFFETAYEVDFSHRDPLHGVDPIFYKRWSPRSFKKQNIPVDILKSIIDAARWSPSCMNEQPWLFVTSGGENDFGLFLDLLVEKNQVWAENASVLGFIFNRKTFAYDNTPNRWSAFDCGAAWMALTLQANRYGLYTHGIGGIKADQVCKKLDVSEEMYEVICGFALGVIDTPDKLPLQLAEREKPSARKSLEEIWRHGYGIKG